jgi:hypothetical protein
MAVEYEIYIVYLISKSLLFRYLTYKFSNCQFFFFSICGILVFLDNCGDGSDENNMTLCATRQKPCDPQSQYQCANKKCIERVQICDFAGKNILNLP